MEESRKMTKTIFEEALNPTPSPKRYGYRLLCYASGVVPIGKEFTIFSLTLEQSLDPSDKKCSVEYHRGFKQSYFLGTSLFGPEESKNFAKEAEAWKYFRSEVKRYRLKIVYKAVAKRKAELRKK